MADRCDILVIGAGLAGLTAARALRAAGRDVLVVEARERPGGRTWTAPLPGCRAGLDWGAEWIIPELHPRMLALAAEFGVATEPESDGVEWRVPAGEFHHSYDQLKVLRPGFGASLAALQAWYEQGGDDEDRALVDLLRERIPDATDRTLVAAVFFPLTGADPAAISTAAIREEIRFHDGDIDLTLAPQTHRFREGTGAIVAGLAEKLAGHLRLDWPVDTVRVTSRGVEVAGPRGRLSAQQVLVAVPVAVLSRIRFSPALPVLADELADAVNCGRVTKLWARVRGGPVPAVLTTTHPLRLAYDRRVADEYYVSAQAVGDDLPRSDPASAAALIHATYPELEVLECGVHDWTADLYAGASWMTGRAGVYPAFRAALGAPRGPVQLIGGDVADDWSGWMEGAVRSAEQAVMRL